MRLSDPNFLMNLPFSPFSKLLLEFSVTRTFSLLNPSLTIEHMLVVGCLVVISVVGIEVAIRVIIANELLILVSRIPIMLSVFIMMNRGAPNIHARNSWRKINKVTVHMLLPLQRILSPSDEYARLTASLNPVLSYLLRRVNLPNVFYHLLPNGSLILVLYTTCQDLTTKWILGKGLESDGLYIFEPQAPSSFVCSKSSLPPFEMHCRLGHP